ncbi:MAG TPA: lipopolysaccharide assembly protein LapA domain-containing protein [Anaerolineae bacterium]|nr:lipopolysaccharide assembly protein LapA domain-containing protein [Anaerolineae bacterium]
MQIRLIAALVIALLAVAFALLNSTPVTVNLLFTQFPGSLALILLGAVFVGALLSLLLSAPSTVRRRRSRSEEQKRIKELEKGIADRDATLHELEKNIAGRDAKLHELEKIIAERNTKIRELEARAEARPSPPREQPEPAWPEPIQPPSDISSP